MTSVAAELLRADSDALLGGRADVGMLCGVFGCAECWRDFERGGVSVTTSTENRSA